MTDEIKKYDKIEDMPYDELEKVVKESFERKMPEIKPIPYVGEIDQQVVYKTNELVACCPMTGLPDLYTLTIVYIPDKIVPELKSVRYYIIAYKDMRISHEHLHAKIYKEYLEAVKPKALQVYLDVAIRGGIKTDINYAEKLK